VPRERLDKLVLDRGLAASRERARALIMTGDVLVAGHPETKPGTLVDPAAEIVLRAEDHPYVSRGALKLVKGLDHFAIDPAGAVALDIGASTGGFTDVLLRAAPRGSTRSTSATASSRGRSARTRAWSSSSARTRAPSTRCWSPSHAASP
jgi:ribosomal protein S4